MARSEEVFGEVALSMKKGIYSPCKIIPDSAHVSFN